nr:hypothetical protein [Apium graveolens]QVJ98098.1 hypothetical protein [Apium graveolens]
MKGLLSRFLFSFISLSISLLVAPCLVDAGLVNPRFLLALAFGILCCILLFQTYLHCKRKKTKNLPLVVLSYAFIFTLITLLTCLLRIYFFSVIFLGFAFSLVLCAEAGQQPEAAETSEGSMNSFDSGSWITKWYGRGMESSNAGSDPGEGPSFIQRRVPGESTGPQYVHVSSDTDRRGPPAEQEAPQLPPSEPPAQPAAGPSNANSTFPYDENHTIGGDSVASIRNRILANAGDISYEEAHYRAEDLFEIKTKLIQRMAQWDIDGDWMNRGARALDYPKTKSGEYSLDQLYAFHSDLEKYGPMSDTFSLLKEKVFRKRP